MRYILIIATIFLFSCSKKTDTIQDPLSGLQPVEMLDYLNHGGEVIPGQWVAEHTDSGRKVWQVNTLHWLEVFKTRNILKDEFTVYLNSEQWRFYNKNK